jgi:hypothetical protein
MSPERRSVKGCVVCAWRADCNKKFSISQAETFNCPEYTYDVSLDRKREKKDSASKDQTGGT